MKTIHWLFCLGLGASIARADNPPIEPPPGCGTNSSSFCNYPGALISWAVSYTNTNVAMGQPITAPVDNVVFSNGQAIVITSWKCLPPGSSTNTVTVTYTPSSCFTPPIPSVLWVPGTYYFANLVKANSSDETCPSFEVILATNVITVSDNYWGSCVETNYMAPLDLVSWWKAEGNALDAVGTNNGTLIDGTTFAAGQVGQAFNLDGLTNCVKVTASSSLDVGSGQGFTIAAWINPLDNANGHPVAEWNQGPGGAYGSHLWVGHPSYGPGYIFMNIVDDSGVWHTIDAQGVITNNGFQHVAVTYDYPSGMARLFVNGVVVNTVDLGQFTPETSYDLYFGCRPGTGYAFEGLIDEVTLYSHALYPAEIQDIYSTGRTGNPIYGRLGLWHFDTNGWVGVEGQWPLTNLNVQSVFSSAWGTKVLDVNTNIPAKLRYRDVEGNGLPNLTPQCGTVRFWFKPDWVSYPYGRNENGPGCTARLIEMGSSLSNGWWALVISNDGTHMSFISQANGVPTTHLSEEISWWDSRVWHQIALTYCPTGSSLYLDGSLAACGSGVTGYPGYFDRTNGFSVGSDSFGTNQAHGQFKDLETFSYPLALEDVTNSPTRPATTVSVYVEAVDGGLGQDGTEAGKGPPGSAVTNSFTIECGLLAFDLPVFYRLSGSATNGVDYEPLSGQVIIHANSGVGTVEIDPIYTTNRLVFDTQVVLTLIPTNGYWVDPTNGSATMWIDDYITNQLFDVVADLYAPQSIDYSPPPLDSLIVSYDMYSNNGKNFVRMFTSGTNLVVTDWSEVQGLTGQEVNIATVKATANGFTNGDMYFGSGNPGELGWVSADGSRSTHDWLTLSNEAEAGWIFSGSVYVDQTGLLGTNALIAVTGSQTDNPGEFGHVWSISASGSASLLTTISNCAHLEGIITLPNDSQKWGPWAGKLLTGDANNYPAGKRPGMIYAIDTSGATQLYALGIQPEDFDLIPTNQDLYCTDTEYLGGGILKLPRNYLTNHLGDLLVTQAGEFDPWIAALFIVRWDGSDFSIWRIPYATSLFNPGGAGRFEQATFAPIEVP